MTSEHYKEPVDGKYKDATAAILAGIGSELDTNEELSGTSLESELGQEQAQPTTTGSDMTQAWIEQAQTMTWMKKKQLTRKERGQTIRMEGDWRFKWRGHR